jgi:hypothetical protein
MPVPLCGEREFVRLVSGLCVNFEKEFMMRIMAIMLSNMFIIAFLSSAVFAQGNPVVYPPGKSTKIMLSVEGNEYPQFYMTMPQPGFCSRLIDGTFEPWRPGLLRRHCRSIMISQVQKGFRNGVLAFWVAGEDSSYLLKKRKPAPV